MEACANTNRKAKKNEDIEAGRPGERLYNELCKGKSTGG